MREISKYDRLMKELVSVSNEMRQWYDIDKIKCYSVYIWSKETDTYCGDNIFDIQADEIVCYSYWSSGEHKCFDESLIVEEAKPVIKRIQEKLREIELINRIN